MFDDRTNKRAPKKHVLEIEPSAKCEHHGHGVYCVMSESGSTLGYGRSAWHAWMDAEMKLGDRK